MMKPKKICLLYGGFSREREISLTNKPAVHKTLLDLGYEVEAIDVCRDIAQRLAHVNCDLAFMLLYGPYGEDGAIQGILEVMGIPYTHSDVLASSICMNKHISKQLFMSLGADAACSRIVTKEEILNNKILHHKKFLLKPVNEGSSLDVVMIDGEHTITEDTYPFTGEVMLEEFIHGTEISAVVLNRKSVGAFQLDLKGAPYYTYTAKTSDNLAEWKHTHTIPEHIYDKALLLSEKICKFLNCRGSVRADFIYDEVADRLYILEMNTCPGLVLLPKVTKFFLGMELPELIQKIIDDVPACYNKQKLPRPVLEKIDSM